MQPNQIKVGAVYATKRPKANEKGQLNDRRVLGIFQTARGKIVHYASPAVQTARLDKETETSDEGKKETRYKLTSVPSSVVAAKCSLADFCKWGHSEVTHLMPSKGWRLQ